MPLVVPLACAVVVGIATRLRFTGGALRYAAPFSAPTWVWDAGIALLAAGALAAAWRDRSALKRPGARRALAELSIYPLAFALVWGVVPAYREDYRPLDYALIAALAAAFSFLFWSDRAHRACWGLTWVGIGAALRALALPTAVLLGAGLAVVAATAGFAVRWDRLALNVFTYPLYGIAQLLVLQVFLLRRLERVSGSRALLVAGAAVMFALVHWPNGPLAAGCLLGAAVWAHNFLRFGNLPAIALSMGVLAAVLGNVVPRESVQNARCGPIYVQRKVDAAARVR